MTAIQFVGEMFDEPHRSNSCGSKFSTQGYVIIFRNTERSSFVINAFTWDRTDDGEDFWSEYHRKLRSDEREAKQIIDKHNTRPAADFGESDYDIDSNMGDQ